MERNVDRFIAGSTLSPDRDRFIADAAAAEANGIDRFITHAAAAEASGIDRFITHAAPTEGGSIDRFITYAAPTEAGSVDRFVADATAAERDGLKQSVRLLVANWLAAERRGSGVDGSLSVPGALYA